ncbi:MAG TPA: Fur family transcriptional regulator [Candidatus Paceibacterota bacterium]|nr:Fur family transcriptional regulator [Candidatus Paceibacterota bacterium]
MERISTVAADLRHARLRATRQRTSLLTVLRQATAPLGVEALVRQGRGAFDTATAYRMLEAFVAAGLARQMAFSQDRALYEAVGTHHHHATCRSCGKIVDIEACLPRTLNERVRNAAGFASIDDHALEFFGICTSCAQKD